MESLLMDMMTLEGLFSDMSSGAAMAAALKVTQDMKSGAVVVILPGRGGRYLITTLFLSIGGQYPR
jgi:cysteine synthase B